MTRERDVDRVLEHWLDAGPSEMPDRLFDTVLDRIERVPQERLPRLKLRFEQMTPMLKFAAAAALVFVVAVAGLTVVNRPSEPGVGTTPTSGPTNPASAAPTPSPTATPAPPLEGDWRACPTSEQIVAAGGSLPEGVDNDGCTTLTFHAGVFTEHGGSAVTDQFGSYVVTGDQVRIRRANGEVFLYAWVATPETLEFSQVPGSGVTSPAPWRAVPFERTTS